MLNEPDDISNIWRLCDELSVRNAALLVVGVDPASEQGSLCERWQIHERPRGYEAAKHAISNALKKGTIAGVHRCQPDVDINGNQVGDVPDTTDLDSSIVERDSLKVWLQERGISSGFFFPDKPTITDYLDTNHPRRSYKLIAAIRAWQAVGDPSGTSPKQALKKWLRENAAAFRLTLSDGTINNLGVEEVAKMANWLPDGGSPKTPSKTRSTTPKTPRKAKPTTPTE